MKLGVHTAKKSHVLQKSTRKTMLDAIKDDCKALNLNATQIFVQGPRSSKMNIMDYKKIKDHCGSEKINLYVHSSYVSIGIWNITSANANTPKCTSIINTILKQMDACDELNSRGLVIHISKKSVEDIIDSLTVVYPLIKKYNTPILFEQPALKPVADLTYETAIRINYLTKTILGHFPDLKWGWCIDTAHLYASGIEVDEFKIMKKYINDIEYPNYIKLFHLNGMSLSQFNTGKDTHQVIFGDEDDIWNQDAHIDDGFNEKKIKKSSISIIIEFCKKYNIDCICEINRGSFDQIKFSIETLQRI